jgi:hypothetical protein
MAVVTAGGFALARRIRAARKPAPVVEPAAALAG